MTASSTAPVRPSAVSKSVEALAANKGVEDVTLYHLHTAGPAPFVSPEHRERFLSVSLFAGPPVRQAIDEGAADRQVERLRAMKQSRDGAAVDRALARIRDTAAGAGNLMPALVEAVRANATLGEMCDALREVWGEYEETPVI